MLDIRIGDICIALYENGMIEAYADTSNENLMDKCIKAVEDVIEDIATEFGDLE